MWHVHCIENTVTLDPKCGKKIQQLYENEIGGEADVVDNDKLIFNEDDFEHIDFLWNEKIQNVLKKFKTRGVVKFLDPTGGGTGLRMWGYEFDGEGNMVHLEGKIQWEVNVTQEL